MLARLRAPAVSLGSGVHIQTRAYSYFSQRPGRFFTAAKPGAATGAASTGTGRAGTTTTANGLRGRVAGVRGTCDPSDITASSQDGSSANVDVVTAEHAADASSGVGSANQQQQAQLSDEASSSSSASGRLSSIPPTAPLFHPQPPLPSVHLHEFFAQHRPLLLLDQPLVNLFSPLQSSSSPLLASTGAVSPNNALPTSPIPSASLSDTQAQIEDAAAAQAVSNLDFDTSSSQSGVISEAEADADADADVARILARALVMQRIEGSRSWEDTMTKLGAPKEEGVQLASFDQVVNLDSVKRKRRKKMNKHKYKKRRKVQRAERRRLGK